MLTMTLRSEKRAWPLLSPLIRLLLIASPFLNAANLANAAVITDLVSGTYTCLGGTQYANINELNMSSANGAANFLEVKVLDVSLPRTAKLCYTAKNGGSFDSICKALNSASISVYRGGVNIGTGAATNPFAVNDYLVLTLSGSTNQVNEAILVDSTNKVLDYIQLCTGACSPGYWSTSATTCGYQLPNVGSNVKDIARYPTDGTGSWTSNTLDPGLSAGGTEGTTNTPAASFHHVEIQHGSGTGVTCTSSTLTLRACADTANPCTLYTGGVTGTLSAVGAPAVNWSGGTGFTIGSGGTVTKDAQVTTPGSVLFGTSSTTPTGNATTCNFGLPGSPACTFTAADAMFIFDYSGSPVHAATTSVLPNFVAETAQTVTLRAVRKSDGAANTCVPAFSGTTNVNFSCCYSNPTTGSASVRVNGDANTLSCSTNAACPADTAAGAGTRSIPVTFDASGVASGVTLNYADVGQVKLRADAVASGLSASLSMVGSATFIAAPASFAVTTALNGGATAYVAGAPFTTMVTARNSANSTTPNFGLETTAESVQLLPVTTAAASASNSQLVGPTGASVATGLLTIGSFSFMAGSASDSQSAWSEVGDIILSAVLKSGSYLGSGLSAWGKTSANVGPFRPHHFTTGATEGCAAGSFTYAGQPFKVLVTAMSQDNALLGTTNAVTQNYFGSYAKKTTLSADGASACGDTTNFGANILADATVLRTNSFGYTYATAGSDYQSGVGAWRDGTNLPLPYVTYTAAAPIAPTTLTLCAADADGVTSHSYTQGQVHIRSGRLRIANAFGSEQLALRMAAQTEYYNGSAWATNTDDNCTTFATLNGPTSFTPALGTATPRCLITANTCTSTDGVACNDSAASSKVANGSVGLCVTKPGTAGYVDVTFATPPYLQFSGVNPSARASFGLYSNPVKIIDRREVR